MRGTGEMSGRVHQESWTHVRCPTVCHERAMENHRVPCQAKSVIVRGQIEWFKSDID